MKVYDIGLYVIEPADQLSGVSGRSKSALTGKEVDQNVTDKISFIADKIQVFTGSMLPGDPAVCNC